MNIPADAFFLSAPTSACKEPLEPFASEATASPDESQDPKNSFLAVLTAFLPAPTVQAPPTPPSGDAPVKKETPLAPPSTLDAPVQSILAEEPPAARAAAYTPIASAISMADQSDPIAATSASYSPLVNVEPSTIAASPTPTANDEIGVAPLINETTTSEPMASPTRAEEATPSRAAKAPDEPPRPVNVIPSKFGLDAPAIETSLLRSQTPTGNAIPPTSVSPLDPLETRRTPGRETEFPGVRSQTEFGNEAAPVETRSAVTAPAEVPDRFADLLGELRERGQVEVQMDLHPPELGRLHVHLTMEDGRVDVRLVVESEHARQMLDLQAEPMRVRFAEMGVSLGQFDVRRDGSGSGQEPPAEFERTAQLAQTKRIAADRGRKSYEPVAPSAGLVDVIA